MRQRVAERTRHGIGESVRRIDGAPKSVVAFPFSRSTTRKPDASLGGVNPPPARPIAAA